MSYFTLYNNTSLFLKLHKRQKIILNQNLNPCFRKINFEVFKLNKSFFTIAKSPENKSKLKSYLSNTRMILRYLQIYIIIK